MSGAETDTNTVREALERGHLYSYHPIPGKAIHLSDCSACAADAALSRLSGRVTELEQALAWYAERRNYWNGGTGDAPCATHGGHTCGPHHRDSFDSDGPGARARAALAGSAGQEQA